MNNYTKGEWKVSHPINNDYTIYTGEYGKGIKQIAILFENKPNVEANAHLIAAAPDMYEALKDADILICQLCKRLNPQHASSPYYDGCECCQDRDSRLKALAKAEEVK